MHLAKLTEINKLTEDYRALLNEIEIGLNEPGLAIYAVDRTSPRVAGKPQRPKFDGILAEGACTVPNDDDVEGKHQRAMYNTLWSVLRRMYLSRMKRMCDEFAACGVAIEPLTITEDPDEIIHFDDYRSKIGLR